ncbi:MAG: polyisoprenoid-binding protein [Mesorhizobium sp.]|nr:polyisoprenoid-binding protein [bacterium M00.F.Ca.ET.205.01.1.1]TGU49118.1 polyisoprenoid-binding protein [bacterium M00.F.Ca.ET.152.01.1.1]TGV32859.1 polyisoprenoid-binding protein [Mesorhizobium sp. M00.F.Ca.ET.186.01.1.1]TGZ40096.1 polyisoprenoid-binding protein [bacterium M00.F.Ca.ET.162.01.1.1]TIW60207.1 MAG: polyisoprenoid-binding protein [Mesorhizobium sp.]
MYVRLLGLVAVSACLAVPVSAAVALGDAAGSYSISQAGSSIHFTIGKAGGGGFDGAFARFKGAIRIDNGDVGRSKVDLTIYPESVGTGQGRIDAFLRSDAVFDAANSPEIQFRSTSVTRTSDTSALVTGRLTARGKTSTEKFTAELDGLKAGTIKFHVTGKVLRSRYGMDVGTPLYSNVVDFDMTLTGKRG